MSSRIHGEVSQRLINPRRPPAINRRRTSPAVALRTVGPTTTATNTIGPPPRPPRTIAAATNRRQRKIEVIIAAAGTTINHRIDRGVARRVTRGRGTRDETGKTRRRRGTRIGRRRSKSGATEIRVKIEASREDPQTGIRMTGRTQVVRRLQAAVLVILLRKERHPLPLGPLPVKIIKRLLLPPQRPQNPNQKPKMVPLRPRPKRMS